MTALLSLANSDYVALGVSVTSLMVALATVTFLHRKEREWFRDQIATIRRERRQIIGWTKEGWPVASAKNTALIVDSQRVAFDPIAELPSWTDGEGEA